MDRRSRPVALLIGVKPRVRSLPLARSTPAYPTVADGIRGLRPTLENLARTTWMKIADGRRLGVPMGETGITDHNMLDLRLEHPSLLIHKHAPHEEIRTGADWEWWLATGDDGSVWSSRRRCWTSRAGIRASPKGWPRASRRSKRCCGLAWPDQRSLPVPSGRCTASITAGPARSAGGRQQIRRKPDPRTMSDRDLQLFGCAAADAWMVGSILADKNYNNRHTLRDTYLPVSRPWSLTSLTRRSRKRTLQRRR